MIDKQEISNIGTTCFVGNNKQLHDTIKQDGTILIINFPGSGMNFRDKDKSSAINYAHNANTNTKELILQTSPQFKLDDCSFYTAIYEKKTDEAIVEYNNQSKIHSQSIFEQVIAPLVSDNYQDTYNKLNHLIFRGHCFGTMVIAELETLLKKDLQQKNFSAKQMAQLLSAPKAIISSPALQIDKYPQYFQTTAIANNSDRNITNEEYCGEKLKEDLRQLADFTPADLVFLKARRLANTKFIPPLPEIKTASVRKDNIHFFICNRIILPRKYHELETEIKQHMETKGIGQTDNDTYIKYLKKRLNGHEFNLLPDELKTPFAQQLKNAVLSARNHTYSQNLLKTQSR